ncbi:hypothetical protein PEX1_046270 [Penicillium expansum]|uniref:Uncharacterized protein n=1 Tax=Penicillium expansum TaxID=27334 RepID=A0A0A2IIG2_PENEN|nr:hypothetical protein PEX2_078360 [Penicillium expansum]KGO42188.1 hypothetical protein PEXP_051380 [Penicillium expansum]KGO56229.1 hypothetical protein PEX2_078360 [Penicillium expansum]KGO64243.1 hypothetical protein PEX1_046270 [Penicillium expansum]
MWVNSKAKGEKAKRRKKEEKKKRKKFERKKQNSGTKSERLAPRAYSSSCRALERAQTGERLGA